MRTATHDRPKARTEDIIVEPIDDELVVYDRVRQVAHCLSGDANSVWECCDGERSLAQIADRLGLAPEVVERAIGALRDCGLLEDDPVTPERGYSRRGGRQAGEGRWHRIHRAADLLAGGPIPRVGHIGV